MDRAIFKYVFNEFTETRKCKFEKSTEEEKIGEKVREFYERGVACWAKRWFKCIVEQSNWHINYRDMRYDTFINIEQMRLMRQLDNSI